MSKALNGRYELERELARGGMGVVYLARDTQVLSRPVVVKMLSADWVGDAWGEGKFREELEALTRLDHPGIVPVYDFGRDEAGTPFLVMQYVQGVSLAEAIRSGGKFSCERTARTMLQVGEAIGFAHDHGVLHRDLKPQNVMLQPSGSGSEIARIIDFGLARVKDPAIAHTRTASSGPLVGTLLYAAPEQLLRREATPATDVWAMGLLASEMLTGRPVFTAHSESELYEKQRAGSFRRVRSVRKDVSVRAQRIILRALAVDPARRYPSAPDFARELAAALSAPARPPLPGARAILAGVLLLLLLVAGVMWIGSSSEPPAVQVDRVTRVRRTPVVQPAQRTVPTVEQSQPLTVEAVDRIPVGVGIVTADRAVDIYASETMVRLLSSGRPGYRFTILSERFMMGGEFYRAFNGVAFDIAAAGDNRLLLLCFKDLYVQVRPGDSVPYGARLVLTARLVDSRTGAIRKSMKESAYTGGESERIAENHALQILAIRIADGIF